MRRDVAHRADVEEMGESAGGHHGDEVRERIEAEIEARNAGRSGAGRHGAKNEDGAVNEANEMK